MKKLKKSHTQKKPSIKYASYLSRIKAFIVDLFMIYAPILYIITYVFMGGKDGFLGSNLAPLIGVITYGIIYAIFVSKSAQTPGKKAYEIAIVDDVTHKNISFLRALYRFAMFLFTATTLLGLLLPLYREDKKSLHDLLAKTVVLHKAS